jgi:hypothetical protein
MKWLSSILIGLAAVNLAISVALSVKVASFPYRMTYAQGQTYYRMTNFRLASAGFTALAGIFLIRSKGGKRTKRFGVICLGAAPLLFLFFAPNDVHSITSGQNACINNLRKIDGAKEQWSLEKFATNGAPVEMSHLLRFIRGGGVPQCPMGGKYEIGRIGEAPRCSIAGHTL